MPLPRKLALFNKRYTNRFIEPVVRRAPGFAVVTHIGRVTGRPYETPVYAFAAGKCLIVSLTYGPAADWVQNVMANGGTMLRGGIVVNVLEPTVVRTSQVRASLPWLVRAILRVLRITDFLVVLPGEEPAESPRRDLALH